MIIRRCGAIGASIGTVIAETIVTAIQIYFVRKDINLRESLNISKNYIMASILMFVIVVIAGIIIKNNLASIILQGIIGVGVYIIILYVIKDEFFMQLMKSVKNKIKRNKTVTEN